MLHCSTALIIYTEYIIHVIFCFAVDDSVTGGSKYYTLFFKLSHYTDISISSRKPP